MHEAKWTENLSWFVLVILFQLVGAFAVIGLTEITLFQDKLGKIKDENEAKLCPQDPSNADLRTSSKCDTDFEIGLQVLFNEAVLTAVFISVILMVKGLRTSPSTDGVAGALAISFTDRLHPNVWQTWRMFQPCNRNLSHIILIGTLGGRKWCPQSLLVRICPGTSPRWSYGRCL